MTRELPAKVAVVFIAAVLILVILGMVTLRFLFGDPFVPGFQPGILILAVALSLGILFIAAVVYLFGYVFIRLKRYNRGHNRGVEAEPTEAFNARLNELEQRLTDVQDILITVDEKLSRLQENKGTA